MVFCIAIYVLRDGLGLVEDQEVEAKARIKALRDAARIGIADIEAGRYRTFGSPAELNRHLGTLRDHVLPSMPLAGGVRRSNFDLSLFITNLLNENKVIQRPNIAGVEYGIRVRPRTYGIGGTYSF